MILEFMELEKFGIFYLGDIPNSHLGDEQPSIKNV